MPGRPHRRHAEQCIQRILSRTGEGEGRGTGRIEQRHMNILAVKYHQAGAAIRGLWKTARATLTDLLKRLGTTAEEQLDAGGEVKDAKRIRVGIIGANPDRGWAAQAHIPALKSLLHDFEITALSTSRRESADAAGKCFGVRLAFDNHHDLVNSDAVDVVAVTVKVPYHLELATAALEAGKAVYCEWPLGNGLNEAETLAALAKKTGVLAVAGLQARSAPAVAYVRDLVEQGYVGEVLSTTLTGSGMGGAPTVEPYNA